MADDIHTNYLDFSLDELDGQKNNTNELNSGLIEKCLIARSKKIQDLSIEEIRVLISQNIGLPYIVPHALTFLEMDPLTCASLYKGDLIHTLLGIDESYWDSNIELNNRLADIKLEIEEVYQTLTEEIYPLMTKINYKVK